MAKKVSKHDLAETVTIGGRDVDMEKLYETVVFGPNQTFKDPYTIQDLMLESATAREIMLGLELGFPVRLPGSPGVGKSAVIRCICDALDVPYVVINAPNRAPEDSVAVFPHREMGPDGLMHYVIERKLDRGLTAEEPFVLIVEEMSRAHKQVQNQLLELVQERRLADVDLNVIAVFACDNRTKRDGIKASADFTLADRWTTHIVHANDLPWRQALAAKYSNIDLSAAFAVVDSIADEELRYNLSNRTFEHILFNILHGNPGVWGLGIKGTRNLLRASASPDSKSLLGEDRTDEIIGKIADALGREHLTEVRDPFVRAVDMAVEHGVNLMVQGPPGIGKTSYVRNHLVSLGYDVLVLSGPVVQPENMVVPIPAGEHIELVLMDWFARPVQEGKKAKVLVLDEIWRAPEMVRQRFLEILQENTLGGIPIEGLACVIGLNNPKDFAGFALSVDLPDQAQSDRFFMSIEVTNAQIPWANHLTEKYGEVADTFIKWWNESLSTEERQLITARTVERLIVRHMKNGPLENALPYMENPADPKGGDFVPVSLRELEQMLKDRVPATLTRLLENFDETMAMLKDNPRTHPFQSELQLALTKAELAVAQRPENRKLIVKLYPHMSRQVRMSLLRAEPERLKFFSDLLIEANAKK